MNNLEKLYSLNKLAFVIYNHCLTLKPNGGVVNLSNQVLMPILHKERTGIFKAKKNLVENGFLRKTIDSDLFVFNPISHN